MDDSRFDAFARTLATKRSRRSALRGIFAVGAGLLAIRVERASAAPDEKVTICHFTGSSTNPYEVISVSGNALESHQQHHGDFVWNGCCLDSECAEFANSFCDSGTCACAADTCAELGVECGVWDDGCGGAATGCVECADFPNSYCDQTTGACACAIDSCADLGVQCGTWSDGCGGTAEGCTTCTDFANSYCNSDGQCACVADTCVALGVECGTWDDGCGGDATGCTECTAFPNSFCDSSGHCACAALTRSEVCTATTCGTLPDGCGGTHYCGCCDAVISSSPADPAAGVIRDDDLRVQVNGTVVYHDNDTNYGPTEVVPVGTVRNGDEIAVVAYDPDDGNFWAIDPLYLHCPAEGRSQALDTVGFFLDVADGQTAPLPNGFYDRTFTVAL